MTVATLLSGRVAAVQGPGFLTLSCSQKVRRCSSAPHWGRAQRKGPGCERAAGCGGGFKNLLLGFKQTVLFPACHLPRGPSAPCSVPAEEEPLLLLLSALQEVTVPGGQGGLVAVNLSTAPQQTPPCSGAERGAGTGGCACGAWLRGHLFAGVCAVGTPPRAAPVSLTAACPP